MKNKQKYLNTLKTLGMSSTDAQTLLNEIALDVKQCSTLGFVIKIEYRTGDSFNTYDEEEILDLPWYDLEIIQENVHRIQEQISLYESDLAYQEKDEIALKKPWVVKKDKNVEWYSIKLLKDNGEDFQISVSWLGYFEYVQNIYIISVTKKIL